MSVRVLLCWDCSSRLAGLLLHTLGQPCSWCSLTVSHGPRSSSVLVLYQQHQVVCGTSLDAVGVPPSPEVHKSMASFLAGLFLSHLGSSPFQFSASSVSGFGPALEVPSSPPHSPSLSSLTLLLLIQSYPCTVVLWLRSMRCPNNVPMTEVPSFYPFSGVWLTYCSKPLLSLFFMYNCKRCWISPHLLPFIGCLYDVARAAVPGCTSCC